jgi:uncharacterized protein (DUF433 family)
MPTSAAKSESWRNRLNIPSYQLQEAARYAGLSSGTVADWHRRGKRRTLSSREHRTALSYLQLIEVAVVAAFREAGVTLNGIRAAREYVSDKLNSEYPFAHYQFKADGRRLVMEYEQVEGKKGKGKLLRPDQGGQLAWSDILGRLKEFEYERNGVVIRWHVTGPGSAIVIDPRIAFGAPAVNGIPTWVLKDRWQAGEPPGEIADDFGLKEAVVRTAIEFEGASPDAPPVGKKWIN